MPAPRAKPTGRSAAAAAKAFLTSLPADLRTHGQLSARFTRTPRLALRAARSASASRCSSSTTRRANCSARCSPRRSVPEGLLAARGVIKHENILRRVETEAGVANASRRDPGLYYTSVFGKPSAAAPWAWRFEGHHLSINVTQLPGAAARGRAAVHRRESRARALRAQGRLSPAGRRGRPGARADHACCPPRAARSRSIRDTAFPDIVTGNDPKVQTLELAGLAAADMIADEQRAAAPADRAVRGTH